MVKKLPQQTKEVCCLSSPAKPARISQDQTISLPNHNATVYNQTQQEPKRPQSQLCQSSLSIKKSRKSRIYNPDDRFLPAHIKRYYLFPFYYSTLFPYFKISWKCWKPNSVYKKMSQFLSSIPGIPSKTPIQCKSFDQRMKDINYVSQAQSRQVDLLEAALSYLRQARLEAEDLEIINRYIRKMKQKSSYIDFLSEGLAHQEREGDSEELKSEGDQLMNEQKKQETEVGCHHQYTDLIFNEFLDIEK